MAFPIVAIVGTPNVGKSTIFNRIVGERKAIVDDAPGITRDRLYAKAIWLTKEFRLIDTGGIEMENRPFQEQIRAQAEIAIEEADVIVFVVDGKTGISKDDRIVSKILYKSNKPVILAVNKIDSIDQIDNINEFYALGFGDPHAVSGAHGIGIGDLLDKLIKMLPFEETSEYEDAITFSVIGRPNVGKSTLVNALLNKNRQISSNIEGTTRDSIDIEFERNGKHYVAIDTAGLKKRGKIYEAVDKYSALRALAAIDRSDIALFVIDGYDNIREQDKHVVGYAVENNKAIIIVVNKWDLVAKNEKTMSDFTKKLRNELKFLDYAPIVFVSALEKKRIDTIFDAIDVAYDGFTSHLQTATLNEIINDATMMNEAPDFNGGRLRVYYAHQSGIKPPTFVLFVNDPEYAHFSYLRYLENRIRDAFEFNGTPIKFILRKRK